MKKQITVHQKKSEEQAALAQTQQGERVFENVEDMLRFDASQHKVPPGLGPRLERSASQLPPPPARGNSWWSRLFGG
jgi:hypothetical protein